MGIYFGTDGVRGKYGSEISTKLAFCVGNSLGSELKNARIIIGRDTRSTGSILALSLASGAMSAGANVTFVDICPTPAISFLTTKLGFDFGVMITASHNPPEFNGIKIFDKTGKKIREEQETQLENKFSQQKFTSFENVGKFEFNPKLVNLYVKFVCELFKVDLSDKKIVLDCSNGSSSFVAKKIFKSTGAKLFVVGNKPNGKNINKNCGCTHIENLKSHVLKHEADFGFAFDGDADRVIAVDETGKVFDGDLLMFVIAKHLMNKNSLNPAIVVGTRHTNLGVEQALNKLGILLLRTEIGDKFVSRKLCEKNLFVGGEQSGHIVLREFLPTGDGILSAMMVSNIIKNENKRLSEFVDFELFEQCNVNVEVKNKYEVAKSEKLSKIVNEIEEKLNGIGRVMIRISGTEPCIRIMVETQNKSVSEKFANEIASIVRQIDGVKTCAE